MPGIVLDNATVLLFFTCMQAQFDLLTGRDLDVGAVPVLLGVKVSVAAQTQTQSDPVSGVGGALAAPRRRVELVVSRVRARVASVCTPSGGQGQWCTLRSRGQTRGFRGYSDIYRV